MTQATKQFVIVAADAVDESQVLGRAAFFDEDGNPVELGGGSAPASVAWGDVTGKPSTFTPASHTHDISDVTGLQGQLETLSTRLSALEEAAE